MIATDPRAVSRSAPAAARPRVSLITVTYNSLACLRRLNAAVVTHTRWPFEWVIVDNGSPRPETLAELDAMQIAWPAFWENVPDRPRLKVVCLPENRWFTGGINVGLAHAHGDIFVLLNPDIEVVDGWLDTLLQVFDRHPRAGVVGCVLVNERGQVVHGGAFGMGSHEGFGEVYDPKAPYAQERRLKREGWITGALLMIKRDVLDAAGGRLDPRLRHFHSDRVLCERVHEIGREVWMSSLVMTHSLGGAQL